MKLILFQVDAFTKTLFGGNPAAVIPLPQWEDDRLLQQLAMENNVSETVYFVPAKKTAADFEIRWFTPQSEINLCGHATLASAYVLFNILGFDKPELKFHSKSGMLTITRNDSFFSMDFPSWKPERIEADAELLHTVIGNTEIVGVYKYRDLLVELINEEAVKNCNPDFTLMKKHFGKMIITAPGKKADFVSRFFAPGVGIDEDPVTGSAHSQLIPFWYEKLGVKKMYAQQLSNRGGEIWCEQLNEHRVLMSGSCVFYMRGEIDLPAG